MSLLFQIKSYFRFLWYSTNEHGVHSPFVFQLVTKCFYKKTSQEKVNKFRKYKNELSKNKSTIFVTDFGKGSRVFKSNERHVSKIAKIAGISDKKGQLLIRIIEYLKPNSILEIGTSLGIGTYCLNLGNKNAEITTLEGCPNTLEIAKNQFKKLNIVNTQFIEGDFRETLSKSLKNNRFDCVYFDGNHQKKATIDYFETYLNHINNNSFFIFDDINWSKEMTEAWDYIKNHEKVTVSIDLYFWGIVFFRKEQAKEHFTIRV